MKLFLIDDDDIMRSNLENFLNQADLGCEIQTILFRDEEEAKGQLQELEKQDFLLIDLFLKGQEEARTPYRDMESVRLALELEIPQNHIIFYSNANVRETDDLFAMFENCHYLPIRANAFDRRNQKRYEGFGRMREDFLRRLNSFIREAEQDE